MFERAYKYRFYPTQDQAEQLSRTFGCVRVVYNWALNLKQQTWRENQENFSYAQLSARLTQLKKQPEYTWLNEVSCVPLQQSLRHLDRAYRNFFDKRASYPSFKSKHHRQAAEFTRSAFTYREGNLSLAKIGPLDVRWSRPFSGALSSVTVSRDAVGRYYVSILVKEAIEPKPPSTQTVGVDLGLNHFAILSDGTKIDHPKFLKRDLKSLARAQQDLARKQRGSNNRTKARQKVARIHARIADRRHDFLHKLSTRLIDENQVICVEDLAVENMVQNRCLARAIADSGWSEFVRQLDYKARWYGRTLQVVRRFFPSSKQCSDCEHILDALPLSVRQWTCPACGVVHDRDINAACNLRAEGLSVLACGEPVSPDLALASLGPAR